MNFCRGILCFNYRNSVAARRLVRHKLLLFELGVLRLVSVDTILDLATELSDKTLDRPGSGVAQGADSVSFDLVG